MLSVIAEELEACAPRHSSSKQCIEIRESRAGSSGNRVLAWEIQNGRRLEAAVDGGVCAERMKGSRERDESKKDTTRASELIGRWRPRLPMQRHCSGPGRDELKWMSGLVSAFLSVALEQVTGGAAVDCRALPDVVSVRAAAGQGWPVLLQGLKEKEKVDITIGSTFGTSNG